MILAVIKTCDDNLGRVLVIDGTNGQVLGEMNSDFYEESDDELAGRVAELFLENPNEPNYVKVVHF